MSSRIEMAVLSWFNTHKPTASIRTEVLLASFMWTAVGIYLSTRGAINMLNLPEAVSFWGLIISVFVGMLKALLIFDKTAILIMAHIESREEGTCLGGFLSFRNWGMILGMILLGRLLRLSPLPGVLVWGVYVAVGAGLCLSSRLLWKEWIRLMFNPTSD